MEKEVNTADLNAADMPTSTSPTATEDRAPRTSSIVDMKPPVEFLTMRNLDTGETYIVGETEPEYDLDTFELTGDCDDTTVNGDGETSPSPEDGANTAVSGRGGGGDRGGRVKNNTGWWDRMLTWIYHRKNKDGSSRTRMNAGGQNGGKGGSPKGKTPFTKLSSFKFHRELGKGAFGRVLLAEAKIDGKLYALKIISKKDMRSSDKRQAKAERDILLAMSHNHSHPFTTGLKFAFQSAHNLYLGMDYFPGGNLKELIRKRGHLCEDWVRFYAAELILAISHLHSLHVIYRDIKPHNIMIDASGHIILIDYGLSKQAVSDSRGAQSLVGTPDYSAPEVLKTGVYRIEQANKEKERKKANKHSAPEKDEKEVAAAEADIGYGKAADWWSVGVMMYEMLSGTPAFRGKDLRQTYQRVLFAELVFEPANRFSEDAKEILRGLLTRDPSARLGAGENPPTDIMSMNFFKGIDWVSIFERQVDGPVVPGPVSLAPQGKQGKDGKTRVNPNEYSTTRGNLKLNIRDSIISPGQLMNDPNNLQDWSFFDEGALPTAEDAKTAANTAANAKTGSSNGSTAVGSVAAASTPSNTNNNSATVPVSVSAPASAPASVPAPETYTDTAAAMEVAPTPPIPPTTVTPTTDGLLSPMSSLAHMTIDSSPSSSTTTTTPPPAVPAAVDPVTTTTITSTSTESGESTGRGSLEDVRMTDRS